MPVAADVFGTAYLDAESFRAAAELFGVGMSLADYPVGADEAKLTRVLQAASRAIDAFCGKVFTPGALNEKQPFDKTTSQFRVNNPPVATITSCVIRVSVDNTVTVDVADLYINNQKGYVEIGQDAQSTLLITQQFASLSEPIVEVTYTSLATVPKEVALAAGFQAGHMINSGFVDKIAPPNFGKLDMDGLKISNEKGSRSQEQGWDGSMSPDAVRLLTPHKRFVAA